ncbi:MULTISPECIES: PCMD domain-containing protein [Bacteroides]|uniref:PCMD domain-containing protein n=1 Tax=Bacteroides TaxID=816 RepID=UPI001EF3F16E|nr:MULTISPECIES: PCMD domain-containing protein [Bacteroides]
MKKNLFFYVFAVLCTMPFFTSCSDDDEDTPVVIPVSEEIAGNYKGTLDVTVDGQKLASVAQRISVAESGDNAINLSIADFSFLGIEVGDIDLNNCALTPNGERYDFTGVTTVESTILTADVNATGYFNNGGLHIDLDIDATLGGQKQAVTVTYDGTRLTGNESSAAQITSFTFDTSVAANAAVLSQPVIDEANATITFKAEEDGDVSALVPTIEVSAGATVTPASGSAVSFASGSATFTVVAEDGTSKTYTVSCNMGSLIQYDFETWATPEGAMSPEVVNPEGWATCNDAVALIKNLGSLGGITYTGEYPVRQTTDAHSGSTAAMLESVDTQGGNIFGQTIPKVTAGSMFLGTFNAFAAMTDPMATTEFGILYDKKPVKVSGYYKYTPGAEFYNAAGELQADQKDACAISAVLYEVESEDETLNGSTIYTSDKIVAMASFSSGETVAEYTPFELNLEYVKDYDASKTYKFAVIFSASADGAAYNAAVGSTLYIDDVTIENEAVTE